jgi:hypothetical protein
MMLLEFRADSRTGMNTRWYTCARDMSQVGRSFEFSIPRLFKLTHWIRVLNFDDMFHSTGRQYKSLNPPAYDLNMP